MTDESTSVKIGASQGKQSDSALTAPIALVLQDTAVFVGGKAVPDPLVSAVSATAATLFGARGACLIGDTLWICDTGHHRLLGFKAIPGFDGASADVIIGHSDFFSEGRNAKGAVSATSLNVPTGICRIDYPDSTGLVVADAWNHRVLIWRKLPTGSNQPPDLVLGQPDFVSGESNQGRSNPDACSMHWPYGVYSADNKLYVADSGNRRVLIYNCLPTKNNQPADMVLGQTSFYSRDQNAGADTSAMSMCWPHGIAHWQGRLCVSDAGNNRIMIWDETPVTPGQPCNIVLGQVNLTTSDHNQSRYLPGASTLNMPYALASYGQWLIVADTANSRLLAFDFADLTSGAAAKALFAQSNFNAKGDNRWKPAQSDSLCWPYNISVAGQRLVISDSGNNRVSIWKLAL